MGRPPTSEECKQEILRVRYCNDVHARMSVRAFHAALCQSWRMCSPVPSFSTVHRILREAAAKEAQVRSIMPCKAADYIHPLVSWLGSDSHSEGWLVPVTAC